VVRPAKNIRQIDGCPAGSIPDDIFSSTEPLILRGLVAHWPIVQAARQSARAAADYIQRFDRNIPLTVYVAPPEANGRIFYNEDYSGFNFRRTRQPMKQVIEELISSMDQAAAATYYIGSTLVDHWLPGFRDENDIELGDRERLTSIWLGNRSRIAAHFDFPNNIACSVAGRRRFTLFPPEQVENLYVGPLDRTPSGQPISLVDTCAPDLDKFPKYAHALAASYAADLEPGDAIFIPSMWWHHVESLEAFNVLVNYWWRSTPAFQGSPLNALNHAIMSLRDLPVEQRRVWRDLFQLYVFNEDEHAFDHIPEQARGVLGKVDEASARALKAQLVKFLK
jgi:hypothetical protein